MLRATARLAIPVVVLALAAPATGSAQSTRASFAPEVSKADRAAYRAALRAGRDQAREVVDEVSAAVPITVATHVRPRSASFMLSDRGAVVLDFSTMHLRGLGRAVRDHTVWHELAHVVDLTALDARSEAVFAEAFSASRRHRSCFRFEGTCLDGSEVFAEQFAFWATGRRALRSSYGVPPLLGPRTFGRLLTRELRVLGRWAPLRGERARSAG